MGNPWVFFHQPVPTPANTVPLWVWVQLPPRVSVGHCGFYNSPWVSAADYIFGILFKYIKYRLSTFTVIHSPSARIWSEGGGNSVPPLAFAARGGRVVPSCRPHPHCTPFPPHEQLLVAAVGGAVVVGVLRRCLSSLSSVICRCCCCHFHLLSTPRAVAHEAGGGCCVVHHHGWSWWGHATRLGHRHLFWGVMRGSM